MYGILCVEKADRFQWGSFIAPNKIDLEAQADPIAHLQILNADISDSGPGLNVTGRVWPKLM